VCANCHVLVVVSGSAGWARTSVIQWPMTIRRRIDSGGQLAERDFRPQAPTWLMIRLLMILQGADLTL